MGCGTADILELFEQCEYTGVDFEGDYINHAKTRYAQKGWAQFICADVNDYIANCTDEYDLILMTAMIHHISDDEIERVFKRVTRLLSKEGRFISYDPVYVEDMSGFEKFIADNDRGKYVRSEKEYVELNKKYWDNVSWTCRKDLVYTPCNIIVFLNSMELKCE